MATRTPEMKQALDEAFKILKPFCNMLMRSPSVAIVDQLAVSVRAIKPCILKDLHQYIIFPSIACLKSDDTKKKYDLQIKIADLIRNILQHVTINNTNMFTQAITTLVNLVIDASKTDRGMIADVPEEVKLAIVQCITAVMLASDVTNRKEFLKSKCMLASTIFLVCHLAKLEKLRALRLAALDCVKAATLTHPKMTDSKYHSIDGIDEDICNAIGEILPGILSGLQDVAMCKDNPGHAVVLSAVNAIHRITCVTMADRFMPGRVSEYSIKDFAQLFKKAANEHNQRTKEDPESSINLHEPNGIEYGPLGRIKYIQRKAAEKKPVLRSWDWYELANEKLLIIARVLMPLKLHDHPKVRKELAIYCYRIITECNRSMSSSLTMCMDILISLSKDEHPDVAKYCKESLSSYFRDPNNKLKMIETMSENMLTLMNAMPRIFNDIDGRRKSYALSLALGYVELLSDGGRPERLTMVLTVPKSLQALVNALIEAVRIDYSVRLLALQQSRDLTEPPPTKSPWCELRHLQSEECERRLQQLCALLSAAECAEIILDRLLELFYTEGLPELIYIMNWFGSGPNSTPSIAKRILDTYLEEDVWYLPLVVWNGEAPPSKKETLDVNVYNPRAWSKDSVPGLYEGTVETRYSDISYQTPRGTPHRDPDTCATLREAQTNMVTSCLLTEGVGMMAKRLMEDYQPYLMKSLCMILERVGSKYEMLHLAGVRAACDIASACSCAGAAGLVRDNADYITATVTRRLKKAWDSTSALQILSVVLEYSDSRILDYLYGIFDDVLLQSCDKYYEKDLCAYLNLFLTYMKCIHKWFPTEDKSKSEDQLEDVSEMETWDFANDLLKHINTKEESERLLDTEEFEKETGKSVEEMYKEDQKKLEEEALDYDDKVSSESPSPPNHIQTVIKILKRCVNFVSIRQEVEQLYLPILALDVLNTGLPLLKPYENELLPLIHLSWDPLVSRFEAKEAIVMKRAFDLLVTMVTLSNDFLQARMVKDVLEQHSYSFESVPTGAIVDAMSGRADAVSDADAVAVADAVALGPQGRGAARAGAAGARGAGQPAAGRGRGLPRVAGLRPAAGGAGGAAAARGARAPRGAAPRRRHGRRARLPL